MAIDRGQTVATSQPLASSDSTPVSSIDRGQGIAITQALADSFDVDTLLDEAKEIAETVKGHVELSQVYVSSSGVNASNSYNSMLAAAASADSVLDWTADQGATNININNYTDSVLSNIVDANSGVEVTSGILIDDTKVPKVFVQDAAPTIGHTAGDLWVDSDGYSSYIAVSVGAGVAWFGI